MSKYVVKVVAEFIVNVNAADGIEDAMMMANEKVLDAIESANWDDSESVFMESFDSSVESAHKVKEG